MSHKGYLPTSTKNIFRLNKYFTPCETLKNKKNFLRIFYAETSKGQKERERERDLNTKRITQKRIPNSQDGLKIEFLSK